MNPRRLLARVAMGNVRNVGFGEFVQLVEAFGFRLARVSGSHHIFARPGTRELVNLQEVGGKAKPYQIRQFLALVESYNLSMSWSDSE